MIKGDIEMYKQENRYDFTAIGQAVKAAREGKGWTREQVAEMLELAPRYIMSIENKGQHPSFNVFYKLVTLFDISVDQYLFPDRPMEKSSLRRQLDAELDGLDEKDLVVIKATVKGLKEIKSQ